MATSSVDSTKPTTEVEIRLSATGLATLPQNVYENDFAFIVGDRQYRCPSFVACFLSPRVCDLQRNDPTIREFHVETPDPNHSFESILKLGSGSTIRIARNDSFIRNISSELWNRELYESINGNLDDELSLENVITRIQFQFRVGDRCERELEYCAKHLYEFQREDLCSLPFEIFSAIVSHESIQLKDEDSFYSMIHSRICGTPECFGLLELVRFEYLSLASIESFIDLMNGSVEGMTLGIWRSVCRRLSFPISGELWNDRLIERSNTVDCPFSSKSPLEGIISYLTKKHGGNIHAKGIVTITSKSVGDNGARYALKNVADLTSTSRFQSKDEPGQWVCWDFGGMRVLPTHYTIDSSTHGLASWVIEGSVDGRSWTEIDRRQDNRDFTNGGTASFATSRPAEFGFIRFTQTDKKYGFSYWPHVLGLYAVEFFGTLAE
jgi:hypothetical protein